LKVGDPSLLETDMGPLTTKGQLDIVVRQVEEALAGGARALTGGRRPNGPGFFYPPTVLVDVHDDMEAMREETFGPTLPVVAVDSIDEAIWRANQSKFGLTASGWTRSRATAEKLQRELSAGVVMINEHAVAFAEQTGTWGGVRESGIGRAHGEFGIHELVNVKYVPRDSGTDKAMPWYYPYGEDLNSFLAAALPLLYGKGLGKFSTVVALARTKRFWQRIRKGTLLANLHKLF
jgi:succinate-semialdehyde dehydrogenase/glutarate-semialdehyde dehydrogenase